MKKDFNRIIYYFMGIIILTVYSLEGTNLHSDFTTTLVSYIILISALSQFYEWGYGKKKYKKEETPNSIKYIERSERVTGVLFLILFIYNRYSFIKVIFVPFAHCTNVRLPYDRYSFSSNPFRFHRNDGLFAVVEEPYGSFPFFVELDFRNPE